MLPASYYRSVGRQAKIASQIGRWAIVRRPARIQMPLEATIHKSDHTYLRLAIAGPIADYWNIPRQAKIASQIGRRAIIRRPARIQMPLDFSEDTYLRPTIARPVTDDRYIAGQAEIASQVRGRAIIGGPTRIQMPLEAAIHKSDHTYLRLAIAGPIADYRNIPRQAKIAG
jgi:hypothetical protein